jgi:hypothetical protein
MMSLPSIRRDESAERFLRAIADRLPADRVVEVYLFPPLRQGPLESGVAVLALEAPPADGPAADNGHARLEVYTATYRHTRKGPDRGAWIVEVVAQADAPLDAVARVVRGVQRRAGDGLADAERLTGADFRSVTSPPATATPSGGVASSTGTA